MLGWLCIVQSPCAYTPGIRAGAECGAAALTKQGRLKSVAYSRCTTQRHQRLTTRLGLRPKPHIIKNIVYRQSKRGFIPLLLQFYPFLTSFPLFLSLPFRASAFSASEAVYRPPHRPHRIYSGILAVSACLYAFYRNTTS